MDGLSLNSQASINQAASQRLDQLEAQFRDPENKDQKALKKAAQEFESIFVQQFLEAMDKTVDRTDSIMSGGSAEEYFRGMMNEHVAKNIATGPGGSGFGLAEAVYRDMARNLGEIPLAPKSSLTMGQPTEPKVEE